MIDVTILFLTVSDCSDNPVIKKYNIDARVNHNFKISTIGPLKKVFSGVIVYDFLKRYIEVGVKRTNKEIINIVKKERPEYVLWPSMTYELLESTFDEIRRLGTKVIGWFFDDEVRFDDYSKWWIPYLDYILTTDAESVEKYTNLGAKALHFLVYSNPDVFRRLNLPERYDLSFVGTKIADREELVNNLRTQAFSVEAFGRGWDSGYISLEQMIEIYNTSRINLCFTKSYGMNTRPQMKCKIFDICLCGGFLLCEYIPGIENYYNIGREIVCFDGLVDAKQKIEYYLKDENERKQITEAGYRRAIQEHSCQTRFSTLFQTILHWSKNNKERIPDYKNSVQLKVPWSIRKHKSEFHSKWAKALLLENYKNDQWRDEIVLALSYYPFNVETWYQLLISCFPLPIREKAVELLEIVKNISRQSA